MSVRKTILVLVSIVGFLAAGLLTMACPEGDHEGGDNAKRVKSVAELPGPVREALGRYAPAQAKPESMEREEEQGLVTWSAEYETDAGDVEITALSDGTLVSIEHESKPAALPKAVADASRKALGGRPKEADHVQVAVYELEDRPEPGMVRERFVDPFGRVVVERIHKAGPEHDNPEEVSHLPAAVRATLDRETGGAELTGLQTENEWGHTVHAASWQAADGPREIKILENGQVLYTELPTGHVPAAVEKLVEEDAQHPQETAGVNEAEQREETEKASQEPGEEAKKSGMSNKNAEAGEVQGLPAGGVERMLIDAWEVRGKQHGRERELLILSTGEVLRSEPLQGGD